MSIERTFGIVKPDAVEKNAVGGVIEMIEKAGLKPGWDVGIALDVA